MNRQTMILVGVVAVGLVTFVLLLSQLKKANQTQFRVVIATTEIPKGVLIQDNQIGLSKPAKIDNISDYYLQPAEVAGLKADIAIQAGEPILRSRTQQLMEEARITGPKLPIPQGMSAMTLSVEQVDQMPEYIQQGQYVDVLGFPTKSAEIQTIIVHSALTLSVQEDEEEGRVDSFSVALTPQEAELVATATTRGKVRVMVRSEKGEKPDLEIVTGSIQVIRGATEPQIIELDDQYKQRYEGDESGVTVTRDGNQSNSTVPGMPV